MTNVPYTGDERFRPLSAWGYVGYSIVFAIPLVGIILLIVFALDDNHIVRRNFARSYFCVLLLALIVSALVFGIAAATGSLDSILSTFRSVWPNANSYRYY